MIPDRLIEKVHLGEATEDEKRRVLADPEARARLEALPGLDRAFLAAHPADELVPKIQARARVASARDDAARRRAAIGGVVLMPLLAGGLALLMVAGDPDRLAGGPEPTTAKGKTTAKLRVYRQRAGGAERLGSGAVVREGDTIQLGIVPGGEKHAVVVSVDGRASVTLHWPPSADGGTALQEQTPEQKLARAYELDDAPDYERFFLVADDEPIDVEGVVGAAEALAASGDARVERLPLPGDAGQVSVLLRKEPR